MSYMFYLHYDPETAGRLQNVLNVDCNCTFHDCHLESAKALSFLQS